MLPATGFTCAEPDDLRASVRQEGSAQDGCEDLQPRFQQALCDERGCILLIPEAHNCR